MQIFTINNIIDIEILSLILLFGDSSFLSYYYIAFVYINENVMFPNALSSSFAAILPMKCLRICIKS